MPRREGMERKDLLKANAKIFQIQGNALDRYAKKTVKVRITYMILLYFILFYFLMLKPVRRSLLGEKLIFCHNHLYHSNI